LAASLALGLVAACEGDTPPDPVPGDGPDGGLPAPGDVSGDVAPDGASPEPPDVDTDLAPDTPNVDPDPEPVEPCDPPPPTLFGEASCGALEVIDEPSFGNVAVLAERQVNTASADTLNDQDPGYNALNNLRARHRAQCRTWPADLRSLEDFSAWRGTARLLLRQVLRIDAEMWTNLPLDLRVLDEEDFGTHTRLRIDYRVAPDQRIPAFLFLPANTQGQRRPGVVFLHGHDEGAKNAAAGIEPWTQEANYHGAAARRLAEEGLVVLAPDVRTFGETGSWSQHIHASNILHLEGRTAFGMFTWDTMRALDALATLPQADPARLGVAGVSMGGMIALFTAALDPRVRAASIHGALGSLNQILLARNQDPCNYIPGFDRLFDLQDVALMAWPTPLVFAHGRADGIFPIRDAEQAFEVLRQGYDLTGRSGEVSMLVHGRGHVYEHEPAHLFLLGSLGMPVPVTP
jgi:pimeloyl-ACP methyl ester carboxylesterase